MYFKLVSEFREMIPSVKVQRRAFRESVILIHEVFCQLALSLAHL